MDEAPKWLPICMNQKYVVFDLPIKMARTIVGIIEDTANDEEFETSYMDDQKESIRSFLEKYRFIL